MLEGGVPSHISAASTLFDVVSSALFHFLWKVSSASLQVMSHFQS